MASGTTDNTAVNRLIDLAQQRPVEADETLFEQPRRAPLPPPSRARGATLPPPLPRVPRATGAMPVHAAPPPAPPTIDEHEAPTRPFDLIEPDAITAEPAALADDGVDIAFDEPAPEVRRSARHYVPRSPRHEETQIARVPSLRPGTRSWLWIAGAFAIGVTATAVIAWPRGSNPVAPAPIAASAPPAIAAPIAPPVVAAPVAVPAPVPVPVSDSVPVPDPDSDPVPDSDPDSVPDSDSDPVTDPVTVTVTAPAVATSRRPPRTSAPRPTPPRAAPTRVAATAAIPAGRAVVMLGSKPPCEILVDGKRTGLTTPQRALALAPGPHKITLVNAQYGIRETFTVTATAGAAVKVVKDLTAKMRR